MNVQIGDRVHGNWGAMFPTSEGTVVDLDPVKGAEICWDNEYPFAEGWHEVNEPGHRSVNGSPIGVTLKVAA